MSSVSNTFPLHDNHSYTQIVQRVPKQAHVLELGCGNGAMSQLLSEFCQAKVVGVDQDEQALMQAAQHCHRTYLLDLELPDSLAVFAPQSFDVITLVDVLEHLRDPAALLQRLKPLLRDGGLVLMSVPNVAHASVRLGLLSGAFDYEDSGILDKTHLRFFTEKSLHNLLAVNGYAVQDMVYTYHDLPDAVIAQYVALLGVIPTQATFAYFRQPQALAYQFIVAARLTCKPIALQACELPPLAASWDTWGRLHGELAAVQAELARVYATRSWRLLRRFASIWRSIQLRFTRRSLN